MNHPTDNKISDLVSAYITRYAEMHVWVNGVLEERDINYWAYETLGKLVQNAPEQALAVIAKILAVTDDDYVLSNLATGPLEDLLRMHGPLVIAEIEERSRQDERFRALLAQVDRVFSDELWVRIEAATDHNASK